jgi:hypothetical protein
MHYHTIQEWLAEVTEIVNLANARALAIFN